MSDTNITKKNRIEMIEFLEKIKAKNNDDETLKMVNKIENTLTEKKFGLVFEEHREEVDELLQSNIPLLCEDYTRRICKDKNLPWNFIIEGDNLQALYLLLKTHRGKINVIYIDPPYNTGARDWKYNNDYVDANDGYRHSKWLSMMKARLEIAKQLLADDGILICAIDENEIATLKLLLEDMFGGYQIDLITIVHNPRGIQGDNFSYVNEYTMFVYKKHYKVIGNKEISSEDEIDWSPLRNWGSESLRTDAKNCFYGIRVKDGKIIGFEDVLDDKIHPQKNEIKNSGEIVVYPIDTKNIERKWRYARQSVEGIWDIIRAVEKDGIWDIEIGKPFVPYKTVWTDKKYDANEYGTQLINSMVPNNDFSFPKSIWNVYECLYATTKDKPNAIILDFFAGSGTTGHAVELLNKMCGGNREYILATNNAIGEEKEKEFKKKYGEPEEFPKEFKEYQENFGICTSITFPRMKSVAEGYEHKKDFKEILYEKKLNKTLLKKIDKEIEATNRIVEENKDKYGSVDYSFENNCIKVLGINKKGEKVAGIPHNIKYFKCDWTQRKPEDYYLSNVLLLHIKEMIELENAVEIDGVKNIAILNKDDYKNFIENDEIYKKIENIWVNQNIIFDNKELEKMKKKNFKYIPVEYFGQELKDVAE